MSYMTTMDLAIIKELFANYLEACNVLGIKEDLIELIRRDPANADQAILFMMIAKYLERIGDHAVNIGEWVEYAVTGYHKIG